MVDHSGTQKWTVTHEDRQKHSETVTGNSVLFLYPPKILHFSYPKGELLQGDFIYCDGTIDR